MTGGRQDTCLPPVLNKKMTQTACSGHTLSFLFKFKRKNI